MEHRKIETSPEVWAVLKARHTVDLTVFATCSHPDGDPMGDPDKASMYTEYGFKTSSYPLMAVENTWEINRETPSLQINEKYRYWLCIPVRESA